jgi:hypothetical protein
MTETPSPTSAPLVWVQDDVIIKGKKGVKMICILEPSLLESSRPPAEDLQETIEALIEIGLSQVERMGEILQLTEEILRRDGRFQDIASDMKGYREIVFKEDRCLPFTMIEARAILSKLRKWLETIERRLEAQQVR